MPRQRGGGARRSSASSGGFFKRSAAPAAPPPMQHSYAPPPAPSGGGGGLMANMAANVAGGMASGVGFGVAQRAVDAVMGPRQMEVVHSNTGPAATVPPPPAAALPGSAAVPAGVAPYATQQQGAETCRSFADDLNQCIQRHSDLTLCQHHLDALKQCQAGFGSGQA